jgi:hypothetical protein
MSVHLIERIARHLERSSSPRQCGVPSAPESAKPHGHRKNMTLETMGNASDALTFDSW